MCEAIQLGGKTGMFRPSELSEVGNGGVEFPVISIAIVILLP